MKKIVIVTRPAKNKKKIQFAFDQLERQGMNPYWITCRAQRSCKSPECGHFAVARPATKDEWADGSFRRCIIKLEG